jgi:hypothetical protein
MAERGLFMARCIGPHPAATGGTTSGTVALEARIDVVAGVARRLSFCGTSRAQRFLHSGLETWLCALDDPEGSSASLHGVLVERGA